MAYPQPSTTGPRELDAGQFLQHMDACRTLGEEELEQHIADCRWLMERSYDRFQAHGNPADRTDAERWMHRWYEAMASRSPEVKEQLEGQALHNVEAAAAYFLDQADRDRAAIAGRGR